MKVISARETFDRRLQSLLDQVLTMGSMVEQAILQAVDALYRHDLLAARRVFDGDQRINEKRFAIENECVSLIATQQPMGRDVRLLAAVLEIITELERIGDYAKGISKINLLLGDERDDREVLSDLQEMASRGLSMLRRSLDAFIAADAKTALAIPAEDDEVDGLFNKVYQELAQRTIDGTASIDHASHLIWAAHNLERMADRVINICERIIYVSTGEIKEMDSNTINNSMRKARSEGEKENLPKVLFLCTHNSARSQMAEAFMKKYSGDKFDVHSAGLEPGRIHPLTERVMQEIGISLEGQRSKGLDEYLGKTHFAYLITVCDRADQRCPIFPGMGTRLHWSFEDPSAAEGSDEEKIVKFRQVRDQIESQVLAWTPTSEAGKKPASSPML